MHRVGRVKAATSKKQIYTLTTSESLKSLEYLTIGFPEKVSLRL